MKEFFPTLHAAALFSGISDDELASLLSCLGARIDTFPKGSHLLRAGEAVEEAGLVLAGSALIMQEDIWGKPQHPLQDRAGADLRGCVCLRAGSGAERERGGGEHDDGDVSTNKARFERVPLRLLPP